jgi:formylglycine-generating enzyme required for sulfatase activity
VECDEAGKRPYGRYHMVDNVMEWTSSDYHKRKVLRGGSWAAPASVLRSANQGSFNQTGQHNGFRCAQDAPQ